MKDVNDISEPSNVDPWNELRELMLTLPDEIIDKAGEVTAYCARHGVDLASVVDYFGVNLLGVPNSFFYSREDGILRFVGEMHSYSSDDVDRILTQALNTFKSHPDIIALKRECAPSELTRMFQFPSGDHPVIVFTGEHWLLYRYTTDEERVLYKNLEGDELLLKHRDAFGSDTEGSPGPIQSNAMAIHVSRYRATTIREKPWILRTALIDYEIRLRKQHRTTYSQFDEALAQLVEALSTFDPLLANQVEATQLRRKETFNGNALCHAIEIYLLKPRNLAEWGSDDDDDDDDENDREVSTWWYDDPFNEISDQSHTNPQFFIHEGSNGLTVFWPIKWHLRCICEEAHCDCNLHTCELGHDVACLGVAKNLKTGEELIRGIQSVSGTANSKIHAHHSLDYVVVHSAPHILSWHTVLQVIEEWLPAYFRDAEQTVRALGLIENDN